MGVEGFISRWSGREGGAERANYALFLTELTAALDLPPPEPADSASGYRFEYPVRGNAGIATTFLTFADVVARVSARALQEAREGLVCRLLRWEIMRTIWTIILAAAAMPSLVNATKPATNQAIGNFNFRVRRMAVRLEPSDSTPEEIGKAASMLCINEEATMVNSLMRDPSPGTTTNNVEATAINLGITEAVVARLCRKTHDCELAAARRVP